MKARAEGQAPPAYRILRARTVLYASLIAIVGAIMIYALATRSLIGVSAIHVRNPVFVTLSDGSIRNAYTIRLLNKELHPRKFSIAVSGLEGARLEIVGAEQGAQGNLVDVGPDQTREVRVLITAPRNSRHDREEINLIDTDTISGLYAGGEAQSHGHGTRT